MRKLFILVLAVTIFSGCMKDPIVIVGGKGGNAALEIYPQHLQSGQHIYNSVVYIKYNTLVAPTDGLYDDSFHCAQLDTFQVGYFNNLNNGNYYIHGKGYDSVLGIHLTGDTSLTIATQAYSNLFLQLK